MQAAIDELADVGYAGMTIESVARRAGTGKVSVYRRFPGRLDLAVEVADRLIGEPVLPPEPSTLREDLRAWLDGVVALMRGPAGEAMRGLVAESLSHPEAARLADVSRGRGGRALRLIVDRARRRGEPVRDDLTPLQEQTPTALVQHHVLTHRDLDPRIADRIVDEVALPLVGRPGASA